MLKVGLRHRSFAHNNTESMSAKPGSPIHFIVCNEWQNTNKKVVYGIPNIDITIALLNYINKCRLQ